MIGKIPLLPLARGKILRHAGRKRV